MKKIEEIRYLQKSIQLLRKLSRRKEYDLIIPSSKETIKILLKKEVKGFFYSYELNGIKLKNKTTKYSDLIIKGQNIKFKASIPFDNEIPFGKTSGTLNRIYSENFDKSGDYYYRMIIPLQEKINFIFSLENILIEYKYVEGIKTREAIEVQLENKSILLYRIANSTKHDPELQYLVLECDETVNFNQFIEICYSILIGFGFVTGSFVQNEAFFFQYSNSQKIQPQAFYYSTLRDSIRTDFVSVYTNPHGYIHNIETAEKYKGKPRKLSLIEFSKLCNKIFNDDDFKSVILLYLESSIQSLVSSPGTLSIALETLANIIYDENEKALIPIEKSIAKEIRKGFKLILQEFKNKISSEGLAILNSRIEQINQPTNRGRLLIPFRILDIPINDEDINAIEQRNSFLHGKSPMINGEKPEDLDTSDKFRFYLYLKLHTLISAVILKYCGFDSYILNFPKIHEDYTGFLLMEEHYRKV